MSEPSSSANPSKPQRIAANDMRAHLQASFRENREAGAVSYFSRALSDPVAQAQDGSFHLSPIWLQLLVLAGMGAVTFLYFSFAR